MILLMVQMDLTTISWGVTSRDSRSRGDCYLYFSCNFHSKKKFFPKNFFFDQERQNKN